MQNCRVTIATSVDSGQETTVSRSGKLHFKPDGSCLLQYSETQAKVCMEIEENAVKIDRLGDYELHLQLKTGETCSGLIGIGGSNGEVQTKTKLLEFKESENGILLLLKYDLIVSGEEQKMKLRLHAKII